MEKLKILIVDKSVFYKKLLAQAVESTGLGRVVHKASNGSLALERLKQHKTDVVIIDIFIPGADGIETLKLIKKEHPDIYVVIFSASSSRNSPDFFKALNMGALDCILKPSAADAEKSIENIKNQLQGMFTQIMTRKYTTRTAGAQLNTGRAHPTKRHPAPVTRTAPKKHLSGVDFVVIASSTGGPGALETIFRGLPETFNRPVLVVQHMPPELTKKLAQSLGKKCRLPVLEAVEGDPVRPGRIMIAPGGFHMVLLNPEHSPGPVIGLESSPPENGVRPAADVLFRSVAATCRGRRILAVILTGMGSDGMLGVEEMKKTCECYCIAQSEKTCVVYGMPKSVVDAGIADAVEDLQSIPGRILDLTYGRS